jgi:hypothetical protein
MFDYVTAIAKLDLASGTDRPDFDGLREAYPQLAFVFDLLEDKLQEVERAEIALRDEVQEVRRDYERYIESLEIRVQDLRLGLEQIKEFTVDADIRQIVDDLL